jgi:hypothetical protein
MVGSGIFLLPSSLAATAGPASIFAPAPAPTSVWRWSQAIPSVRKEAADRLCFHRVSDNHESHSIHQPAYLAECERVCLGAGLEERDLERPLANPVVLSHELVEAALPEHAVPLLVDVHAV